MTTGSWTAPTPPGSSSRLRSGWRKERSRPSSASSEGTPLRVAITGSTGLIGTALAESLRGDGAEIMRLVRRPPSSDAELRWNPDASDGGLSPSALSGLDAVVHLSGAPVAGGRWTPARKRLLRSSRIGSTSALVHATLGAAAGAAVRVGDRLVRRHRHQRRGRGSARWPWLPRGPRPGLGDGGTARGCGRRPRRLLAIGHCA